LYGGTGLGLNITKSIVDLYGGTLSMESLAGEGTTFHFILPFKKYIESEELAEINAYEGDRVLSINLEKPIHILLAEDNNINAMLAMLVLKKKGFIVTHVVNGIAAVEAVQHQPFDLILMDIQMPVLNGIDATKAIRKLSGDISVIPIVAMTAHSLNGEMQNCYKAGMNGYVAKPFKPTDLFSTIIEVIKKKDEVETV
jgi:CheY-like chemotaxis protein